MFAVGIWAVVRYMYSSSFIHCSIVVSSCVVVTLPVNSSTESFRVVFLQANGDTYFDIAGDKGTVTQVPILLIVIGIFVLLLGIVGTVGGIFAGTPGGRIILGLVCIIMYLYSVHGLFLRISFNLLPVL